MRPVFCRVPRQVSGTGSVSAELGRRLRHLHHAGDRSAVASTPGGVRPTLQNTGREVFRRSVRMKTLFVSLSFRFNCLRVGPLLAAAKETAAPGGVHPRAAVRIRRRSQQSTNL